MGPGGSEGTGRGREGLTPVNNGPAAAARNGFIVRPVARLLLGIALAVPVPGPAIAADAPASPNYQGLWWHSPPGSESGWGLNVAHQDDVLFATWFTYDAGGRGWWLSMTARRAADGGYTGTLHETTGPSFSTEPFDPAVVTRTAVGSGTLAFRDADNGTFRYTVKGVSQARFITRQVFGPVPLCAWSAQPDLATATNYTDLWWVPAGAESGWGVNLAHQGDALFATWFTYGADGKPTWLSASAPRVAPGVHAGTLVRTAGPSFDASSFDPARVTRTPVGAVTFRFASGAAATMEFTVEGVARTKSLVRQSFAPPAGTRCGEPARAPAPLRVVAAGDIAYCGELPAAATQAARTARLVVPEDDLVLTLGDAAYESGTPAEYANCFHPTWGAFKDRIRPSPGNHDHYTAGAQGYFDYFGAQAGPDRRGYYSFDRDGWHFVSLDAMADLSPGSPQHRWLVADLESARDSLCTLAVLHYPAFNSGANHGSVMAMRPAFDALQAAGVELVLSGHEHVYERFAPQRADGTADPVRGLRQFVVGTGGHVLMAFGSPLPNSEFRHNAGWGVLRLFLEPGRYRWQFVGAADGAVIDAGAGDCHP